MMRSMCWIAGKARRTTGNCGARRWPRTASWVSKDEDFFILAMRVDDSGRLLWLRIGNCRTAALIASFEKSLPAILDAFQSGQRIVELR